MQRLFVENGGSLRSCLPLCLCIVYSTVYLLHLTTQKSHQKEHNEVSTCILYICRERTGKRHLNYRFYVHTYIYRYCTDLCVCLRQFSLIFRTSSTQFGDSNADSTTDIRNRLISLRFTRNRFSVHASLSTAYLVPLFYQEPVLASGLDFCMVAQEPVLSPWPGAKTGS